MHVVSFLGKPIFLFVAVGLPALWLLRRGAHKLVVFLAVTCIGGGLVDTAREDRRRSVAPRCTTTRSSRRSARASRRATR